MKTKGILAAFLCVLMLGGLFPAAARASLEEGGAGAAGSGPVNGMPPYGGGFVRSDGASSPASIPLTVTGANESAFPVSIDCGEGGTAELVSPRDRYAAGEEVQVRIVPDEGMEVSESCFKYHSGVDWLQPIEGGSFIMPAYDTTVVVRFRRIPAPTAYSLTPRSVALAPEGYTQFECTLGELSFGEVVNDDGAYTRAESIGFSYAAGTLEEADGFVLPFRVGTNAAGENGLPVRDEAWTGRCYAAGDTVTMSVYISPADVLAAPAGIYTGTLSYTANVSDESGFVMPIGSGTIALTLTISAPGEPPSVGGSSDGKTVKNYLLGALQPVGKVLYVPGGGWNDSTRKGLSDTMLNWYHSQSGDYDSQEYGDLSPANRARGFDEAGYIGWCAYQVMHEASGEGSGYTVASNEIGGSYKLQGWGTTLQQSYLSNRHYVLEAGNIGYGADGCFIVLGQCPDKSAVILRAVPHAGVQISGTATPSGSNNVSQAVDLASRYMHSRFPGSLRAFEYQIASNIDITQYVFFRWNRSTLADPDGYMSKTASAILADLFASIDESTPQGEYPPIQSSGEADKDSEPAVTPRRGGGTSGAAQEPAGASAAEGAGTFAGFSDVKSGEWCYEAVRFCAERGILNGYEGGLFLPGKTVSRAQTAQLLWNLAGKPDAAGETGFSDVPGDAWYLPALSWCAESGLVTGYADGSFGPERSVTREQFAAILYRYASSRGQGFTGAWYFPLAFSDAASVSAYADEAVHYFVMQGVLQGDASGRLNPKAALTRAQTAAMLQRFVVNVVSGNGSR